MGIGVERQEGGRGGENQRRRWRNKWEREWEREWRGGGAEVPKCLQWKRHSRFERQSFKWQLINPDITTQSICAPQFLENHFKTAPRPFLNHHGALDKMEIPFSQFKDFSFLKVIILPFLTPCLLKNWITFLSWRNALIRTHKNFRIQGHCPRSLAGVFYGR